MWLIGKKFERTVGASFNTINHLCWNILHKPSFSCPRCYFPSLTWYKMYIIIVVLESHVSHAVVEGLRVQACHRSLWAWRGCRFSAFTWCPELTSKDMAAPASWAVGKDADVFYTVQHSTAETPRM